MKVKVDSLEFKTALEQVKPIASEKIASVGAVGLMFSGNALSVKAFSGIWIEVRIESSGANEDVFVAVSPISARAMILYLDGGEVEIDIHRDEIRIKAGRFRCLADKSNDDLSPRVDFNKANWVILPDQFREVSRVCLIDNLWKPMWSVLYMGPDYMFCYDGLAKMSVFNPEWDFDGFAPIPKDAVDSVLRLAKKDDEISFSLTESFITLSVNDAYITTPYPDHHENIMFGPIPETIEGSAEIVSGGTGKVSEQLIVELKVCQAQTDANRFFLWTSETESGLHFSSEENEVGSNSGVVWSDLENVAFACNAKFLEQMIPANEMWNMSIMKFREHQSPEDGQVDQGVLMIETEFGVRHTVSSMYFLQSLLDELRSSHDTTE